MTFPERDAQKVKEELVASWRAGERIRVRELASSHRLEQHLRILEEQEAWKREDGFA